MKATIQDAWQALTPRNIAILIAAVIASVISIDLFGYLVWRRFVTPSLIITAAGIGWLIARNVGEDGFKKIINAASVGMCGFAIAIFVAAFIDAVAFPDTGYFAFAALTAMGLWAVFHLYRALLKLRRMPVDRKQIVTESTADIVAQMTHREERIGEVLIEVKRKAATVGVKLAI